MTNPSAPSQTYSTLASRIKSNESIVGIIGLGYVGLPLAHTLHAGGCRMLGFDIDPAKILALKEGRNYLQHLGGGMVKDLFGSSRFSPTTDMGRLGECDVVIVCVPTPLGRHQEPDLTYVINSGIAIGKTLRKGQLVILESTTYPRTTRDDFLPAMLAAAPASAKDIKVGEDLFVAFSPEREDPGRKTHTTRSTPKLVGGVEPLSTELAAILYEKGVDTVVRVSSAEVAEAAKLLENIFRAVNIAMVNEMKIVLTAMGIDVWEVVRAASTKPFGFMPFYPGPGLGGHCIPIDPFYLTWKAREFGQATRFIELAGEINTAMPNYVIQRVVEALNSRRKALNGSRVLVVGLAYKANVDDDRESPSYVLLNRLQEGGADVAYFDPFVPVIRPTRDHPQWAGLRSISWTQESVASFDCVLISTAHSSVNFRQLAEWCPLIVDTRNAMAGLETQPGHVWKA